MADNSESVVKIIPALGISYKIGDVINCCNTSIVSRERLWPEVDKSTEKELIQENSVKSCSSVKELDEALGIDVNTRIHVELGFIETKGLAKASFLLHGKGNEGFGMAIIHKYVTRKEYVREEALRNVNLEHVEILQAGTHIITGMIYGCQTMFWSQQGNFNDKEVKSLKDLEEFAKTYPYEGKIFSDVCRVDENGTILDAIRHMKDVAESLQQEQETLSAFPIEIHLSPIKRLAKIGARDFVDIPTSIASRVVVMFNEVNEAEHAYSKLQEFRCIKESKAIQQRLTEFKDFKQKHSNETMEMLKELIPDIHQGEKEEELEELVNSVETSPFNGKTSKNWIAMKRMELEQIQGTFKQLEGIHVTRNLKKEIAAQKNFHFFGFIIQIPNKDQAVEQMRSYLYDNDSEVDEKDDLIKEVEKLQMNDDFSKEEFDWNAKNFKSLIATYKNDPKVKFVIAFEKTHVQSMAALIHLFADGKIVDGNFKPLCQPYELVEKEIKDTSLEIAWRVQENSCQKEEYRVIIQSRNQDYDKAYTTEETSFLIPDLKPETDYDVWITAYIAGIESEPSQILKITTLKSDVTSHPGKPKCIELSYPKIRLEWVEPDRVTKPILEYNVYAGENCLGSVDGQTLQMEIDISPNTDYLFTVQACCGKYGQSQHSVPSEPYYKTMSQNDIRKEGIKAKESQLLKPHESPKIYLLNLTETCNDQKLRKYSFGRPVYDVPEKVVMFLGATGSGKTTLINGIINYIVGIKWDDDFRIRLIPEEEGVEDQAKSQTSKITAYTIYHREGFKVPYTLTLVDTPGFGDTSGIMKDREITSQIDHFFRARDGSGLDHIDGIGFVTQSSLARLTPTQRYIFDSILSLFGKDIKNYIFPLLTFADGKEPQVLSSLKAADIPFEKYFKFNNSALFEDNRVESKFNELFWDMGESSFEEFINAISKIHAMSLNLTKEVLTERETLEVQVQGIHLDVKIGLNKLEQLNAEWQILQEKENDIRRSKDFTYTVVEERSIKEDIVVGKYTTNCLKCNRTCHFPCSRADDDNKAGCAAMDRSQSIEERCCKVCPGKCIWKMHKNMSYRFKIERVEVEKTSEDLKRRYQTAKGEKVSREKILDGILRDIENTHTEVAYKTLQIKRCVARLQEIALKPNPLSTVEYVEIMIQAERTEAQPGWPERVQQLNEVKQTAEFIDQLVNKGHDPFGNYADTIQMVKEYYKQRKEKKGPIVKFWDRVKPKRGPVETIKYCKSKFT